jgi:hypothetical protein
MLKKTIFLYTLYIALGAPPGFAQKGAEVIEKQAGDGMAFYTVAIPADEFTRDNLLQLAKRYLRRHAKVRLLNLGIYVGIPAARDSTGKHMIHFTYDQWKQEFDRRKESNSLSAAELLKYGAAATLRIRYSDGRIEEIPITGDNVFHPIVGGLKLNLLHVTGVLQGFDGSKQLIPLFYFSLSKEISTQDARKLAASLLRSSAVSKMEIRMREDEWFIFDPHYPWRNPFTSVEAAPTEKEAARSVEFLCKPSETQSCYQSSAGTR